MLAARVLLSIMPPKAKKPKLVAGQKTLAQGSEPSTALPLESAVSSLLTVPRGWDVLGTPSSRRGAVASWRAFAAAKWRNKHPWIVVEDDGVYCLYCKAGTGLSSGSSVFVSTPFTGTRPDKLVQHKHSGSHQAAAAGYRERQQRFALGATISQVIKEADTLTVDEEAFVDALRVMYFLNKQEIAHTTTFKGLKNLCELLGNDTLQRLRKAKNLNYESEMTMNEMVRAIGLSLEEENLLEARASPYFSLILDKATDISVNKQLGLCI